MRKGLCLLMGLLLASSTMTALAAETAVQQDQIISQSASRGEFSDSQSVEKMEQSVAGSWVDQRGHRPISIKNGQINGYSITSAKDFHGDAVNGGCVMTVIDLTGNHITPINWATVNGQRTLTLQGTDGQSITMVPGSEAATHAESISGIHLDMKLNELTATNGAPSRILDGEETYDLVGVRDVSWYWNSGMVVTYDCRTFTVDRIFMLAQGSCAFDRSVLNCEAPLQRYADLYGFGLPAAGSQINMGNGEIMDFTLYPKVMSLKLDNAYSDESIGFAKPVDD